MVPLANQCTKGLVTPTGPMSTDCPRTFSQYLNQAVARGRMPTDNSLCSYVQRRTCRWDKRSQGYRHRWVREGMGVCKLCDETAELQVSHIVPRFVFGWLKDNSATGFLRFSGQPNLRVQDGPKLSWLCRDCEELLNDWETKFANLLFYPILKGDTATVQYGS